MLKMPTPGSTRRRLGFLASVVIAVVFSGALYASSTPVTPASAPGKDAGAGQYQLDIQLVLSSRDGGKASHARRLELAVCGAAGETSTVVTRGIELDAVTRATGGQRVSIDLAVRDQAGARAAQSRLQGALDQPLLASGKVPGSDVQYTLRVTPRLGCPASATIAAGGARLVTMKVKGAAARKVAEAIASQAKLVLVNPETLDERAIALEFQQMPAAAALQMVARTDGARAVFDGSRARFERLP